MKEKIKVNIINNLTIKDKDTDKILVNIKDKECISKQK